MRTKKDAAILLYDTTLRDGAQRKGINITVRDKLKIAHLLDDLGVHYIEGGWPGSNPKDAEFFKLAQSEKWASSKITAFGSTRRKECRVEEDRNLQALLQAETPVVELVGKSWTLHVDQVLQVSREENLAMIFESIAFMKQHGREVCFAAEHFFDGCAEDLEYTNTALQAAFQAGADWLVLCDTNGGTLPEDISRYVKNAADYLGPKARLAIHAHNDCELAVANSLAAVAAGALQVQGTINGYGERCGNANLISLIPTLQCKLGYQVLSDERLAGLTSLSRAVAEIVNVPPDSHAAYVGNAAFAHKGGIHVAAVEKVARSYEHIDPSSIGNRREIIVSELSGRGNLRLSAKDLNIDLENKESKILDQIKDLESRGAQFELAGGSFELLLRRSRADYRAPFKIETFSVVCNGDYENLEMLPVQAVVKVQVREEVFHTVFEGEGPVHALDGALRQALSTTFPSLSDMKLIDYKVRILDPQGATAATTRVVIEASCGDRTWSTIGCSQNILQASLTALTESFEYFLL